MKNYEDKKAERMLIIQKCFRDGSVEGIQSDKKGKNTEAEIKENTEGGATGVYGLVVYLGFLNTHILCAGGD